MYPDNNWYSHRSTLAEYCGVKDTNAFASIQHGLYHFYLARDLGKRTLSATPYLCWDKSVKSWCTRNNIKNVIPIGSPFIYHHLLYSKKIISKKKRNVILFPSHSNMQENRDFNFNLLIEYIEKKYKPPYTVCFFYKDLNKRNKYFFSRKNWLIVCNGSPQGTNFLKNLYNNLINHNIVVCTEAQTTLFYSLFLKKKTSLVYKIKKKKNFFLYV